jgi:hypothetical protein
MGRHGAGHVRHLMDRLRGGAVNAEGVAQELEITVRRVHQLFTQYLQACGRGEAENWEPGKSGGYHGVTIPETVQMLWRQMLCAQPPAPYAFAASEALRLHQFQVDRATARRWARQNGYAHRPTRRPAPAAVRRWQCSEVGALWQLDASPHAWFGEREERSVLLDMVDDCSRVTVGARLYPHECLMAYVDFLERAFREYGLPLLLYVDYHSFFFTKIPENLTYLGTALRRYDISLKYAPTPQAKGKIERHHQFWQKRLPSYFATHGITQLAVADAHLQDLRLHHNRQEVHRELRMKPQEAWTLARREHRYVLRPCRMDRWWTYVWSVRQRVRVGPDGYASVGSLRLRIPGRANTWVCRCDHPDGCTTFLANEPGSGGPPIVLVRYEGHSPLWTL